MTTNPMHGGTFEEWLNVRPLSAREVASDHERELDAAWEANEARQAHLNKVCAAIRACPADLLDRAYIAQVLNTLAAAAHGNKSLDAEIDALDICIGEVEA